MSYQINSLFSRRSFLAASLAGIGSMAFGRPLRAEPQIRSFSLRPAPGQARLVPEPYPATPVWGFNGQVPGPELRVRQGDRLRIVVTNGLDEETTVHWHGLRLPNAMDGVPHLTQKPIAPGETFTYEFDAIDAGVTLVSPAPAQFRAGRTRAGRTAHHRRTQPAAG